MRAWIDENHSHLASKFSVDCPSLLSSAVTTLMNENPDNLDILLIQGSFTLMPISRRILGFDDEWDYDIINNNNYE